MAAMRQGRTRRRRKHTLRHETWRLLAQPMEARPVRRAWSLRRRCSCGHSRLSCLPYARTCSGCERSTATTAAGGMWPTQVRRSAGSCRTSTSLSKSMSNPTCRRTRARLSTRCSSAWASTWPWVSAFSSFSSSWPHESVHRLAGHRPTRRTARDQASALQGAHQVALPQRPSLPAVGMAANLRQTTGAIKSPGHPSDVLASRAHWQRQWPTSSGRKLTWSSPVCWTSGRSGIQVSCQAGLVCYSFASP
mmetsp:Transcript_87381/g.174532  ORF Transcript_87381/g.174532 Transcript_87381/m.174532 type:complete len:249 (-) Transcript_87381:277-1023(-)